MVHYRCSDVLHGVSLSVVHGVFVDLVRLVATEVEVGDYLGDILNSNGGGAKALSDRVESAWGKFQELSGV